MRPPSPQRAAAREMSKAAGLEVRMPLTDLRIFDIASRMPSKYKVNSIDEHNKLALRKAASGVLPEEIAYRKKLGFVVPIRMWMADERYNGDVRRLFDSDIAEKFFNVNHNGSVILSILKINYISKCIIRFC